MFDEAAGMRHGNCSDAQHRHVISVLLSISAKANSTCPCPPPPGPPESEIPHARKHGGHETPTLDHPLPWQFSRDGASLVAGSNH